MFWLALVFACGDDAPPSVDSLALARHPARMEQVRLPKSNRPKGRPAPDVWALRKLEPVGNDGALQLFGAPLPARLDFYGADGVKKPPGLVVRDGKGDYRFEPVGEGSHTPRSWGFDRGRIVLRLPAGSPPPKQPKIAFPRARKAEDRLNFKTAGIQDPKAFVVRDEPVDGATRHGLYLPAPASASWLVTVPENAVLEGTAAILEPGLRTKRGSGGAELRVDVNGARLATLLLEPDRPTSLRVDLSAYPEQTVRLELSTDPGEGDLFDYVFLAEPVLRTQSKPPRKLLLVFVDTLRQDHLGVYGYPRDTTPAVDAWAERALLFEQARAVSPWTMPSGRAAVSGREPERWRSGAQLPEILGAEGFTSIAVVGNKWLSEAFDYSAGWSLFDYEPAAIETRMKRLQRWLDEHEGRDVAVLLHIMEPHLPYREPEGFQGLFAGDPPPGLEASVDSETVRAAWAAASTPEQKAAVREYVVARYDQNIRYFDAQLAPLLDRFSDEVVVFFSDHGEEFWEHGDAVEHGHSLSEELLRVPLLVSAPGLEAGRSDVPATLTDVLPTVLDLLEVEGPGDLDGVSLLEARADRGIAVGWTLFGDEGWGAVLGNRKWVSRSGHEAVYDLVADPREDVDLNAAHSLDTTPFREVLAQTRGRPVVQALRVVGPGEGYWNLVPRDITIEVEHPGGFQHTWTMWDPRQTRRAPVVVEGERLVLTPQKGLSSPREFFALPLDPAAGQPSLRIRYQDTWYEGRAVAQGLVAGEGEVVVRVTEAVVPLPVDLPTYEVSEAVTAALEALGYVQGTEDR